MSDHNFVRLHGTVSVRKSWPANGEKQALVVGTIRPTSEKTFYEVKAFGEAAQALGNAHELTVTVEGRLGFDKPKEPKAKWPMVVVVERVREHEPRGTEEPF